MKRPFGLHSMCFCSVFYCALLVITQSSPAQFEVAAMLMIIMLTFKAQHMEGITECPREGAHVLRNISRHDCVVHPLLSRSLSLVAIRAPWCLRVVLSVWQVKFSLLM